MSDADKKAAARAAYGEGVELQDKGKWADALADFEKAEKLFDAPTHLLHMAECQVQLNKLVEASESYEALIHKTLDPKAPDAFVQAQKQGQTELDALKPRIPTLRVNVKPEPSTIPNLQVSLNDKPMPNEMIGIARPVNPGAYKVTASGSGWGTKDATTIDIKEKETKSVDLTLEKGATGGVTTTDTGTKPPPTQDDQSGPSPLGLLFGIRPLVFIPFGSVDSKTKMKDYAGVGAGAGLDIVGRVAQRILVGASLEGAIMGAPSTYKPADPAQFQAALGAEAVNGFRADVSVKSEYLGLLIGYMPDVDKITLTGMLHGGYRYIQRSVQVTPLGRAKSSPFDDNVNGIEAGLAGGVSIPAGPMRIVPLLNFDGGQFSGRSCVDPKNFDAPTAGNISATCTAPDGGVFFMVGLSVAVWYHLDFGRPQKSAQSNNLISF
jgi:hypothetical protein